MAKKGESLIEVVVSTGILMIVFSGIIMLVVASINLNLDSRTRSEAIFLAQSELNQYLVAGVPDTATPVSTNYDSGACPLTGLESVGTPVPNLGESAACQNPSPDLKTYLSANSKNKCSYLVVQALASTPNEKTGVGSGVNVNISSAMKKAELHVRWYSRGIGDQEFILTQMIRTEL